MNDLDLLKSLQRELISTLERRATIRKWIPRSLCKTKIRRLRLQIQEVMLRIECSCESTYIEAPEAWYKKH